MRKFLTICAILLSLSASAQWQLTGSRVRYVNGIGIPTRDTSAMTPADSSQILIRPADSSLYVRYKRAWQKVGAGGGGISGSGTTNYVPKFTASTTLGNSQIFDNGTSVGINSTIPDARLRVAGTSNGTQAIFAQVDGRGLLIGTSLIAGTNDAGSVLNARGASSGTMIFQTDSTERMRISSAGNVGINYTAPAAKLAVNGTALINTNTDNGVDALQVSGSAVASVLKATGTGNNLAILNGTGTTNSLIDFQNAASTKWRLGNNYNGNNQAFVLSNLTTTKNNIVVLPNNKYLFNSDNLTQADTFSDYEFHKVGSTTGTQIYLYNWNTGGVRTPAIDMAFTRGGSQGSYSATQNGDVFFNFGARGSTNSGFVQGGFFNFEQEGSVSSFAPTKMFFSVASATSLNNSTLTISGGNGYSSFNNKLLIATTTDNGVDELQVNGSIQGTGFNQAYLARTTTYTAANTDYFIDCTSGTFTVNLFTAVGNTGRILIIKNSGTGTITVDPSGSQTIDGATTQTLSTQWSRVHIISDGANWKIISN